MKDEMCNFYMMYWYDPKQNDMMQGGTVENSCEMLNENDLKQQYPADSDVPLPNNGPKMEMKRNLEEGRFRWPIKRKH